MKAPELWTSVWWVREWPRLHLTAPSIIGKIMKVCGCTVITMASVLDNSVFCETKSLEPGCKVWGSLKCKGTNHTFLKEHGRSLFFEENGCFLENDTFMCCSLWSQWGSGFTLSLAVVAQVSNTNTVWQCWWRLQMPSFTQALILYSACCTAKLQSGVLSWSSAAV